MTWFGWLLVSLIGFKILMTAALVNAERKPIKPEDVVLAIAVNCSLIFGVFLVGTGSVS